MSLRFVCKLAPAVIRSTKEQREYYRDVSGDTLARRWQDAVNQAIRSLRTMPERGGLCDFRRPALAGIRRLPIEGFPKHLVFYRVDLALRTVLIVDVLHGACDLERELWASGSTES